MSLEMKPACELCQQALPPEGEAYICSYECTFCKSCSEAKQFICPNCQGELVRRPRKESGK